MGQMQPTGLADSRGLLAEDSAATLERSNIGYSIEHRSIPMVRKPDSSGLPPASEALGGARKIGRAQ